MAAETPRADGVARAPGGPAGPHAEATEVWPRDGVIRIVGGVHGFGAPADGWTLESRARERQRDPSLGGRVRSRLQNRLRAVPRVLAHPVDVVDGRFEAVIDIRRLTPPHRGMTEHWDLFLVRRAGAERRTLRVGRWLDEMPGKKSIVTFPAQSPDRPPGTSVRPYFTSADALAIRARRKSDK
ncbi:hypothetical protein [Actinomadura atramentaria]|uniref:hypothetical protein n=1 Tax=Actinomadura atramentaria TaxID=1990 RepID=UPI00036F5332|nr:hypothetical protein [Actinomadura atramentaria]